MRSKLAIGVVIGIVVGVLFSAGAVVLAGALDPSSGPTSSTSQMFTLQQIYSRLTTGAAGTRMTSFTEPSSGPGSGTMADLNDIMAVAPSLQTNAATPEEVASGSSFWGLSAGAWGLLQGTRQYLPVEKTGVTDCYYSLSPWGVCDCGDTNCPLRQDGYLEMGVDFVTPRFTVNGDGTVTDNMTDLVWLQNANCAVISVTWQTAFDYVEELNTSGTMNGNACGDTSNGGSHQTDWRLPNINELHSLSDYSNSEPSLPTGHPFTNVELQWYWTSTPHNGPDLTFHSQRAWYVSMYGGRIYHEQKDNTTGGLYYDLFAWPVRGGQ